MSEKTEEERRAIIRSELDSTESDNSSTNPGPNTGAPSPFFPHSSSSTSSSSQSEANREYAKKEAIPCTVSNGSSHTATSKTHTAVSKTDEEKESESSDVRMSRNEEAQELFCPGEENLNEGEAAHVEEMTMDKIYDKIERIKAGLINRRLKVQGRTGVGKTFAQFCVKENQADLLKFSSILRPTARLEPYVLSMDRRFSQQARTQRILNELLAITKEEYKHINTHRFLVNEVFQRVLKVEELYEETVRLTDETRGSAFDIFQETLGTEYIPEITDQDLAKFDRVLGIASESNSGASTSRQRTSAEVDLLLGVMRTCLEPAELVLGKSPESNSEKLQRLSTKSDHDSSSGSNDDELFSTKKRIRDSSIKSSSSEVSRKDTMGEPSTSTSGLESSISSPHRLPVVKQKIFSPVGSVDNQSATKRGPDPSSDSNDELFSPKKRICDSSIKSSSSEVLRKDIVGELSTSTSGLESSISSPRRLPVVKQKILSPVGSVDNQSATKRGPDPSSDSNDELFSPKKRICDSSIKSSSSEVLKKDTVGEPSTSTSGLESSISSPHRLPVVKQKIFSPVGSVDNQSATKRGPDPSSDLKDDEALFSPKKRICGDSPIKSSSSEVSRKDKMGEPSTNTSGFYSNASQRPESMADISESAAESRESAPGMLESSESSDGTGDRTQQL